NLAFDDHWVDENPAIIGAVEFTKPHGASVGINDDDGEVHALRIVSVRGIVKLGRLEPRLERAVRGKPRPGVGDVGNLGESEAAIGAADAEDATSIDQVVRSTFQHFGRKTARLGDDLIGRPEDCGAGDRRRPSTPGTVPKWNSIGIALDYMDLVWFE